MAEGHLKVTLVPAGPVGMEAGLAKVIRPISIITSFHDPILAALRHVVLDRPECELLPFGALVGRFLRMTGEADLSLAASGHAEAMIARIAPTFAVEESLAKSVQRLGTIRMLHSQFSEFRDWDIGPPELRRVAETAEPSLARRLRFVADVAEKLEDELQEQGRGFASALVKRSLGSSFDGVVPDRHVICLTGPGEHPLYESWLTWLPSLGVDVDVIAEGDDEPGTLFASSAKTAARIKGTKSIIPNETWTANLFRGTTSKPETEIQTIQAADKMLEAEWVVREAMRDVNSGTMPFRIGFFARDLEGYAPLILAAADRLGLPVTTSISVPLLTTGFARLTREILTTLAGHDVRGLARLSHSSYLRVPPDRRELLWQGMREAHRKKKSAWTEAAKFAEKHQEDFPWLNHILKWRVDAGSASWSLAKWSGAIRLLLGGTDIVDLSLEGTERSRRRDLRAQTVLQRSISERATAVGENVTFTLRHFLGFANRIWQDETVFAPFGDDGVQICQSTQQLQSFDVLYALGMVEGSMPRRRQENAMFSDVERNFISQTLELSAPLLTSRDDSRAERDEFVRLASAARKKVVFSYPDVNQNRENVRTFYLDEVVRATGESVKHVVHMLSDTTPEAGECRTSADIALRSAIDGPRSDPRPVRLLTTVAESATTVRLNDGVTLNEIADAAICPFRSVASHRLGLVPPARAEGLRSLLSLPERAKLPLTKDEESARATVLKALEERVDELFPFLEPWEVSLLQSAGVRLADEWVQREFAAREGWGVRPIQSKVSHPIREPDLRVNFKIGSREFKLIGTVPAMISTDDFSLISMFVSTDPDLFNKNFPRDQHRARYGLLLLSQYGRKPNVGIQVDIMGDTRTPGRRAIYTVTNASDLPFKTDAAGGLTVHRENPQTFLEVAKAALTTALDNLDSGRIEPIPGDTCSYCGYGELCRSAKDYGEHEDRFGGPS